MTMEANVKELNATSFGWIIAYVLPGLLGLYSMSFCMDLVRDQLKAFSTADSTIGLFFLALLTSLLIGLELTAVRWVVFECWLCKGTRLQPEEFAKLQIPDKIAAFRTIADEHYKYHQFWGSMAIVIPFFLLGLAKSQEMAFCSLNGVLGLILGLLIETITIMAAMDSYKKYVDRSRSVLSGE